MSLSISAQSNSYLAKKLGKSESNQTGASSRTQVAQNLQTSSAKTTRTLTLGSKKQSNFVAGRGNTPELLEEALLNYKKDIITDLIKVFIILVVIVVSKKRL